MASGDAVSPPRRAGRQSASVVPPKALSSRPRCSGCVDDRLPWIGESVDMFRFVPRPFVVIGAVVVMLPLGGCLATTVGSFAATALMSAATGSTGPETPPTIGEQLSAANPRVLDSCRAQIEGPDAPDADDADEPAAEDTTADVAQQPPGARQPRQSRKQCAVKPVCLPGHSQPTMMMVCQEPAAISTEADGPEADPRPRRYQGWDWGTPGASGDSDNAASQPDDGGAWRHPTERSAG